MRLTAIGLAVLLCGCGSQAPESDQPSHLNPAGDYIHRATGFTFPPLVGPFKRSGVTEYNSEKTDVSAGYDKVSGEQSIAVTAYVYPAPPLISIGSPQAVIDDAKEHLCTQVWEGIKSDITRAHPDAELVALDKILSPSPGFRRAGRRAVFRFSGDLGGISQPLQSEADLFCYAGQSWLVAYRTTAPARFDYHPDLDAFMRALRWPGALTG